MCDNASLGYDSCWNHLQWRPSIIRQWTKRHTLELGYNVNYNNARLYHPTVGV